MRPRAALLGVLGTWSLLVGLAPTTANAKAGTPMTMYAYEEIGPHSLLADPGTGVQYMEPTCTPDFTNCVTYEFNDRWDVAPTASETDDTNVFGYLDSHGVDNFVRHTVKGTLTLTVGGVTWTGGYSGTFSGPRAATGSFSLLGTDGSKLAGSIAFLDDGLMSLTGYLR
jgi:hypothetical protein